MRYRVSASLLVLLITTPLTAQAGQIVIDSNVSQKGTWDSNPLMLTSDEKNIYGSTTTAGLSFKNKTPLMELGFNGRVTQNFFNRVKFNSTDFYGGMALSRKSQKWDTSLKGNIGYDTTRSSEISTFGQNVGSVRRTILNVNPNLSWAATNTLKLGVDTNYQQINYDSATLVDYQTASTTPSITYQISPAHAGMVSLQYGQYHADNVGKTRIKSISPSAGWMFELTPRLSGQLFAGANLSQEKNKGLPKEKWKTGTTYEAEISYEGKQNKASLGVSRGRQAYSNGSESLLTGINFEGKQKLNDTLSLNLTASYQFSGSSGSSTLKNKLGTTIGLSYLVLPDLTLTSSYAYRHEEYNNPSSSARGNVAMLTLKWNSSITPSMLGL